MILRSYRTTYRGQRFACVAYTKSDARGIFKLELGVKRLRAKVRLTKRPEPES